ncbi:MAG: hypothetical protein EXS52_02140 [Candidatus Staskawiczbacteria bacterium]|nr:hypothetical protein [Candidatus Staskawiczbacteria bacterium]
MDINLKQLILDAKNICVIPSQLNEPESLTASLALFYTLKDLQKNVNLIINDFPEKLSFLVPSLEYISSPKNFVISIPKSVANISQIHYEKNEENVKIHLQIESGGLQKENISFYYQQAKPDLVITLGINNFQKELESKLDSFGFLMGAPIINIDNSQDNTKFGQINIIEGQSLSESTMEVIALLSNDVIKGNTADCILTGLVAHYENFKSPKTTPAALKLGAQLMEKGADHRQIIDNLYKTTPAQMEFLTDIFKNLKNENDVYVALLDSPNLSNFGEAEAKMATEKINSIGLESNVLALWDTHNALSEVKGFFYSKNQHLLNRVAEHQQRHSKNNWVFLSMPEMHLASAKEKVITLLV